MEKKSSGQGTVEMRELAMKDLMMRASPRGRLAARAGAALARRLATGEPCPALIVRPHPRAAGKYQIIDGHCRARTLKALGRTTARCEVWPLADEQAEELAITLNHLRGRPDVRRRALAARRIVRRLGEAGAAEALGLTVAGLKQWLRPLLPPRAQEAQAGLDLRPLVFHVTPAEAEAIGLALRRTGNGTCRRGQVLARALRPHWQNGPARKQKKRANEPNCQDGSPGS